LDEYYVLQRAFASGSLERAHSTSRRFEEFDDAAFQSRYCRQEGPAMRSVVLVLQGVHCAACVWLVEKLPLIMPGIAESSTHLSRRTLRLVWNPAQIRLSDIARRLASFGYIPHALTEHAAEVVRRAEDRRFLVRIAVAGALAGNVMLLAFALYGGVFHGIESQYYHAFRWLSMALALIALVWPGNLFFRGAINAIRARTAQMDVPIAVGLAAGMAWSCAATVRGIGEVYFDSVTLLVFLLLVGRWIQLGQQRRSRDAISLLFSMTPRHARVLEAGTVREVLTESLHVDQIVEIRAGETVPIDGVITAGESSFNLAWLTGESAPVHRHVGDTIQAGSVNIGGLIHARVESTGESTRAGRLMRFVEESAQRRAPIVRIADRIAGHFVIAVLALAALTMLLWSQVSPTRAIEHAMALLIITCPCALGLATPLAMVAAIGRAARRGILIKGGEVLEALARNRGIVFLDKTGTLTDGCVEVRQWHGPAELKHVVAAIEVKCAHPVAAALSRLDDKEAMHHDGLRDVESLGNGVAAVVDGVRWVIGTRSCMASHAVAMPAWACDIERQWTHAGLSPVFIAVDGHVQAAAGVGDAIRPNSADVVAKLRGMGWQVAVLSGDHPDVVRRVGAEIGLAPNECMGGVSPEEKLRVVERAVRDRAVVMVGDGINDAAALSAATVGVAVRGGAEASLASADVYLNTWGLESLVQLLRGSQHTFRVIKRGLLVSLSYNVVGSVLAMAGLIDPIVAAVLMPTSSLTVIALAVGAKLFGEA
jgi:Cu2+-exporting ATPase